FLVNSTSPPHIHTLSLHDALPICHENRHPSRIPYGDGEVRLRQYVPDPFDTGGDSHGRLLAVPSVLHGQAAPRRYCRARRALPSDRKSTRLNSSHVKISYAVFCLK